MEPPVISERILPNEKWFPNRIDPDTGLRGRPLFIVIHIQQGSSINSWNFHADPDVQASATVFANRDGSIWQCVREEHGPWTNGDVCLSTADGHRVRNLGGNPNIWCLTIETEGFAHSPKFGWQIGPTAPQFRSVLWQVSTWMERYNIPVENVIRHADLNNCTDAQYAQHVNPSKPFGGRDFCPGDAFHGRLIRELRANTFVDPAPPPPPAFTGADVTIGGHVFHALAPGGQTVRAAVDALKCRKFATTSAPWVRPPLAQGEAFVAHYWVEGENAGGENRWWVSEHGARIWCGGTNKTPDDF